MRRVACLIALAGALVACSLTTSLEGFSSGAPPAADGGADVADAATDTQAAPIYASCRAALAAVPTSKDGFYDLDPDGAGPKPAFKGYCDMTNDEGGWLRIDEPLVDGAVRVGVTAVVSKDAGGGVVVRIYGNIPGCSDESEHARDLTLLARDVTWSRVRYKQAFAGRASCWTIAGGRDPYFPQPHRLLAFDPTVDVVRNAVRMGGTSGDAYAGQTRRCDTDADNFWGREGDVRSATFILRRDGTDAPAGLSTVADCGDFGAGTASNTYWEYSDIFVR